MSDATPQFREVWLEAPNGGMLCALINSEVGGWLMYLRESGDAGFSSRNPAYADWDENVKYQLDNGQVDYYPRAWTYPVGTVERALEHFRVTGSPPTFIEWYNDSGDGETIPPREPHHPGRSGRAR